MTALADAVAAKLDELAAAFFTQGVVKPNATAQYVIVDVAGAEVRCPYLQSYAPKTGDVVWLAGPSGSWMCLGTISGIRDLVVAALTATSIQTGSLNSSGNVAAPSFRGNLGAVGVGFDGYGTWHGSVHGDGANTQVDAAYILSGGDVRANQDVSAGRSVGASLNVVASFDVLDRFGNVRTAAGSSPDVKTDLEPIDPAQALAALAKLDYFTFRYIGDWVHDGTGELRRFAGPMLPAIADDPLLATMVRFADDGTPETFDIQSMLGLVAAALPAVSANFTEQLGMLGPLQQVAQSLPAITAHSDQVHDALYQGQQANGQAAADAQTTAIRAQATADAAKNGIAAASQIAAQALAAATTAQASAATAQAQVTSLTTRLATDEATIAALTGRVAALEARTTKNYRAAGNLPLLALNASTSVMCSWPSGGVPNPLPTPAQCAVVQIAGTSATLVPTAVSVLGVTVQVTALTAILTATSGALQVVATTWN